MKDKRVLYLFVIGLCLIGIGFYMRDGEEKQADKVGTNEEKVTKEENDYSTKSSSKIISTNARKSGIVSSITGPFSDKKVTKSDDVYDVLEDIKDELKFKDAKKEFKLDYSETVNDITYYRFKQMYQYVEVYNNDIIVSVDKDGNVLSFSGYYVPNIDVSLRASKDQIEMEKMVKEKLGDGAEIYDSGTYIYADDNNLRLVYAIVGYSNSDVKEYIVDANSGEIIISSKLLENAENYEYTGLGINDKQCTINIEKYYDIPLAKDRYRFIDEKRNISIFDQGDIGVYASTLTSPFNVSKLDAYTVDIENGSIVSYRGEEIVKGAVTTMKHFEEIYDYYKDVLGRNSYDNKGSKIKVMIGVKESTFTQETFEQAAWVKGFNIMLIGDKAGKVYSSSKDVLGHEFTHGVIQYTAKFANKPKEEDMNKAFETGALNEGISDIMGSLIEGKNWTIAEDNEVVRDLANPGITGNPIKKGGDNYVPDGYIGEGKKFANIDEVIQSLDNDFKKNGGECKNFYCYDDGGVHDNSTVISHAAYKMYESGAFASREEMAKIFYNALLLSPSYCKFLDYGVALIRAAQNYGLSESSINKMMKVLIDANILGDTRRNIEGNVYSGKSPIEAKIQIYVYGNEKSSKPDYEIETLGGKFTVKLLPGTYTFKVKTDSFEEYTEVITINGDTKIDIELASLNKNNNTSNQSSSPITNKILSTNNYHYKVDITAKTGYMDVTTTMDCIDDWTNKLGYCKMTDLATETEIYYDYSNKVYYQKRSNMYTGDNGKWEKKTYNGEPVNTWIKLSEYITDIKEETQSNGTLYKGKVDSKKIASAMSNNGSEVNLKNIVSNDIPISVFVNDEDYLEKINCTLTVMGIDEEITVKYDKFNKNNGLKLPSDIK